MTRSFLLGSAAACLVTLSPIASTAHHHDGEAHSDGSAQLLMTGSGMAQDTMAIQTDSDMIVMDPYARASTPMAKSGAAFMAITNTGDTPDRLIAARADVAQRVELHTHIENDGVMQMVHVEEGFVLAPGETILLERGGKHVMFMGISTPFEQGARIPVTLVFEQAGEVVVEVPVDLQRQDGSQMDHGS